eukprot:GHRR01031932.1.p2 GENE.GHRR01031932.1~~GHRR01031932.1.p2  ORF type:complete len:103 (+),score=9.68 GHRR01031932.1:158-466(+)
MRSAAVLARNSSTDTRYRHACSSWDRMSPRKSRLLRGCAITALLALITGLLVIVAGLLVPGQITRKLEAGVSESLERRTLVLFHKPPSPHPAGIILCRFRTA